MQQYFATCPKGLENLLKEELQQLHLTGLRETVAGVYFEGIKTQAYQVCLWSRIANRVLFPLHQSHLNDADDLYNAAYAIAWEDYFTPSKHFIIDFIGTNSFIRNSQFGAQRVKDAIVDRFKKRTGIRPSVSKTQPHVRINARLSKGKIYFALDYSGESLHLRGYRKFQGAAPLKENLAAAILLRSRWKDMAAKNGTLIDPMCGSGTLLIEAAMQALNIAPGNLRERFGFEHLIDFDETSWSKMQTEARLSKQDAIANSNMEIRGYDKDNKMIRIAQSNIELAGLEKCIRVTERDIIDFKRPTHKDFSLGLLVCNPPYGERLGDIESLKNDYQILGSKIKQELNGWQVGIFSGNPDLIKNLRLRPKKAYKLFNGTIASQLSLFEILGSERVLRTDDLDSNKSFDENSISETIVERLSPEAKMIVNRLSKNGKRLQKWMEENAIQCYRIYDADIPEYNAAVDVYQDCIHVQEYQAPNSIDPEKAKHRFNELINATKSFFATDDNHLFIKVRRKNRGKQQYEKQESQRNSKVIKVQEYSAKFEVNLNEYLDVGLFLDHRPLRQIIRQSVRNKSFLNLFCYTASASVHAALGGAKLSVSVDMSNTYIEWAQRNFELNNLNSQRHQLIRDDCIKWLNQCRQGFDVIMLDPPSFSNSKRMESIMDIQQDHPRLIARCMDLLNPNGVLYFSTNLRSFKLEESIAERWNAEDIRLQTIDPDFKQRPNIHACWKISHN